MKNYTFIAGQQIQDKVESLYQDILSGSPVGKYLAKKLPTKGLTKARLFDLLVQTKKPRIYAEIEVFGDGTDWTHKELSILGDLNVHVPVKVFDNGIHSVPKIHRIPFDAHLLFTPGALLRNGRHKIPTDWEEVVTFEGEIIPENLAKLYTRRLLPLLKHAHHIGKESSQPVLLTIPGIGCGQFAGKLEGKMGIHLLESLWRIVKEHSNQFSNVNAIYYDPYSECENLSYEIKRTQFLVRPLLRGNHHRPQLCHPQLYSEQFGMDLSNHILCSMVAWDHVSWPGNDFFGGRRSTDDGVKSAATDAMKQLTGVSGKYDTFNFKYQPPRPYGSWSEVVLQNKLKLSVANRTLFY